MQMLSPAQTVTATGSPQGALTQLTSRQSAVAAAAVGAEIKKVTEPLMWKGLERPTIVATPVLIPLSNSYPELCSPGVPRGFTSSSRFSPRRNRAHGSRGRCGLCCSGSQPTRRSSRSSQLCGTSTLRHRIGTRCSPSAAVTAATGFCTACRWSNTLWRPRQHSLPAAPFRSRWSVPRRRSRSNPRNHNIHLPMRGESRHRGSKR
mmetsp:Transcript_15491/g.38200  ORF Transcript_15491/g.38200 Transcript_15491/m.38200 type:complete len:205 (-) Transcript_15491:3666-4280(-)